MNNLIVRPSEIKQKTGLSYSTVWRLERNGDFPARKKLSKQSVGWLTSEINAWLASRQNANPLSIKSTNQSITKHEHPYNDK